MDAEQQISVPCAQTRLGCSSTGSPVMTRVQLPIRQIIQVEPPLSFMQVSSVVCKDEKCDDLPDSPEKRKLPFRCTRSNLCGLPIDQPAEQKCDASCVSGDSLYKTNAASFISLNQSGSVQFIPYQQRYQTYTMSSRGNPCPGTPMMQYAVHSRDCTQPYILPDDKGVVQATTGDMSVYQIRSPTSGLSPGIGSSPGSLPSPQQLSDEASRKRELRLMKNREAARECRRKKKEYVKCLENRVAVLEKQNKTLIEELKALKDLVAAKECRRRKKQYVQNLQTRLTMVENQNKKLTKELEYLKTMYGISSSC